MGIFFLVYILVCYKTGLSVYWYDWVIFGLLELFSLSRLLFTDEVKKAYDHGVLVGSKQEEDDIFSDV